MKKLYSLLLISVCLSCKSVYVTNKDLPVTVQNKVLDVSITNNPLSVKIADPIKTQNKVFYSKVIKEFVGVGAISPLDFRNKFGITEGFVLEHISVSAINATIPGGIVEVSQIQLDITEGSDSAIITLPLPLSSNISLFMNKNQNCQITIVPKSGITQYSIYLSGYINE